MSSDYIPRLRGELLRAAAEGKARRRVGPVLRPVAAVAVLALVAAALVIALPGVRDDDMAVDRAATVRLDYRVPPADCAATVRILQERLAAAGIGPAEVTSTADGRVTITVPRADRAAVGPLLQTGRLAIYDWEDSVIGPDGSTAPDDPEVTGGVDAGHGAAVSEAEAQALVSGRAHAVAVRLADAPGSWFALAGTPAIINAQVSEAREEVDPIVKEPIVALSLTADGQTAFRELTRTLGQRGADNARGADPLETSQHFAIVVDDRIVSVPFINWRENPDGIDGARGMQIAGGFTPETARALAAVLSSGPLPAPVQP
jgi:preprotein translocase subunit SecD